MTVLGTNSSRLSTRPPPAAGTASSPAHRGPGTPRKDLRLSFEVWTLACAYLPPKDLARVERVNHLLARCVRQPALPLVRERLLAGVCCPADDQVGAEPRGKNSPETGPTSLAAQTDVWSAWTRHFATVGKAFATRDAAWAIDSMVARHPWWAQQGPWVYGPGFAEPLTRALVASCPGFAAAHGAACTLLAEAWGQQSPRGAAPHDATVTATTQLANETAPQRAHNGALAKSLLATAFAVALVRQVGAPAAVAYAADRSAQDAALERLAFGLCMLRGGDLDGLFCAEGVPLPGGLQACWADWVASHTLEVRERFAALKRSARLRRYLAHFSTPGLPDAAIGSGVKVRDGVAMLLVAEQYDPATIWAAIARAERPLDPIQECALTFFAASLVGAHRSLGDSLFDQWVP